MFSCLGVMDSAVQQPLALQSRPHSQVDGVKVKWFFPSFLLLVSYLTLPGPFTCVVTISSYPSPRHCLLHCSMFLPVLCFEITSLICWLKKEHFTNFCGSHSRCSNNSAWSYLPTSTEPEGPHFVIFFTPISPSLTFFSSCVNNQPLPLPQNLAQMSVLPVVRD